MTLYFSKLLEKHDSFFKSLLVTLKAHKVSFVILDKTNDIWCRDYMPIQVGKDEFAQFSLTKDYYQRKDEYLRTNPVPICRDLGIAPTVPVYRDKPIYLDGGNVIRGFGKAIICDKVFRDNDIPRTKLIDILTEFLRVDQVIIIPQEPEDYTGHADGAVRWLDEKTVLANDYAGAGSNKRFIDRFYGALAGSGLDVLLVPYCPVESKAYNQPATGCYINYLQVGEKVFLPKFEDEKNDDLAVERFSEIFGEGNVITVPSLAVAKLGGVLNCLSWEIN